MEVRPYMFEPLTEIVANSADEETIDNEQPEQQTNRVQQPVSNW
jgi:hypothetical protein